MKARLALVPGGPVDPIVSLAITITKLQAERQKATARLNVITDEANKLNMTLLNCDRLQAEAQREMDKLAAKP